MARTVALINQLEIVISPVKLSFYDYLVLKVQNPAIKVRKRRILWVCDIRVKQHNVSVIKLTLLPLPYDSTIPAETTRPPHQSLLP